TARRFWPVLRPLYPELDPECRSSERRDTATVPRAQSDLSDPSVVGRADTFLHLSDQSRSARALHHADRVQPGAAGHKDRQPYGFISKCAWRAPVSVARHQCPAAGHSELRAAPQSGHLSILLRWTFPAEPVDREFQHPGRSEALPFRLLLSELRQQR